jgi:hypothetical protein
VCKSAASRGVNTSLIPHLIRISSLIRISDWEFYLFLNPVCIYSMGMVF